MEKLRSYDVSALLGTAPQEEVDVTETIVQKKEELAKILKEKEGELEGLIAYEKQLQENRSYEIGQFEISNDEVGAACEREFRKAGEGSPCFEIGACKFFLSHHEGRHPNIDPLLNYARSPVAELDFGYPGSVSIYCKVLQLKEEWRTTTSPIRLMGVLKFKNDQEERENALARAKAAYENVEPLVNALEKITEKAIRMEYSETDAALSLDIFFSVGLTLNEDEEESPRSLESSVRKKLAGMGFSVSAQA